MRTIYMERNREGTLIGAEAGDVHEPECGDVIDITTAPGDDKRDQGRHLVVHTHFNGVTQYVTLGTGQRYRWESHLDGLDNAYTEHYAYLV